MEDREDWRQRPGMVIRPRFRDRIEAGSRLAERLAAYRGQQALILGIPRGGIPVAAEVARQLDADLDVIVARKLGAPGQPELALGAVTADGGRFLNEGIIQSLGVGPRYLAELTADEMAVARRREEGFRGDWPSLPIKGRLVIVVDDGLATGATMRAAVRAVRQHEPARLIVAVPVGSSPACAELRDEADEVICLAEPTPFWSIRLHYEQLPTIQDDEVRQTLQASFAQRAKQQATVG